MERLVCLRGGSTRATTGILMWSKVYNLRTRDNKEVAVVLVDTQVYLVVLYKHKNFNFL